MANLEVLALDTAVPQIRAPGAGDGYSVPRDMTMASGTTLSAQALTAAGNVTLSGGTANGVLYLNGSKVATSGSALVFDGTNLGLGVTPSAWSSSYRALQVGATASMFGGASGEAAYIQSNAFLSATGYKYITTAAATQYGQSGGAHSWSTAASGTAGNAITFTQAMTLDASGNLGVGTTSPSYRLQVETASASSDVVGYFRQSTYPVAYIKSGSGYVAFGQGATSGETRIVADGGGTASVNFYTGSGTERARITSGGDLLVGTTSSILTGVTTSVSSNGAVGYAANNANTGTLAYTYLQLGNANSNNRAGVGLLGSGYTTSGLLRQDGLYIQCGGAGGMTLTTEAAQPIYFGTNNTERARITAAGSVVAGGSVALATTATDGFLYVPTCAGTPTGTPTAITGMAPIVVDTTNNKLYFYSGGQWRDAGP